MWYYLQNMCALFKPDHTWNTAYYAFTFDLHFLSRFALVHTEPLTTERKFITWIRRHRANSLNRKRQNQTERPKWRRQNSERTESFRGFRISASEFSPRGIWGRVKFKPGRRRGNVSEAQPLSTRPVGGVAHIVWQIRETLSSRATVGPFHRQLGKVLCAAWPRATPVSVPKWSRA